jgi:hypothetical protein
LINVDSKSFQQAKTLLNPTKNGNCDKLGGIFDTTAQFVAVTARFVAVTAQFVAVLSYIYKINILYKIRFTFSPQPHPKNLDV